MTINYLIVDKLVANLYKANNNGSDAHKNVLEHEAIMKFGVCLPGINVGKKSCNIFSRIVKKICNIQENEVLLQEIIKDGVDLDAEENEIIENVLLQIEKELSQKMTINEFINKVSNYKNFKPEYN
jgi:uncharacterized transporter YbjL